MKRRLHLEFRECLKCPYCRLIKNLEDSRGDIWNCCYDELAYREVIENKALREFGTQYSNRFPSWCPLPVIPDDEEKAAVVDDAKDGRMFKWTLKDAQHFDLKRAVIYQAEMNHHWRLFATRASTGRTTDSSYEDYGSFEDAVRRFEADNGPGAEWIKEPLREVQKKKK